jgi:pyrroline-5-carboxylate reductase
VQVSDDNLKAASSSEIIILAVLPSQLMGLIDSLKSVIKKDGQIFVSVVSAFNLQEINQRAGNNATFVRAMPNIAAAVGESMTCLCSDAEDQSSLEKVKLIFDLVGSTLIIPETLMSSATILGACGIAFFMRYIRAASQGGIQVGFHAAEAQFIAAQTARGATSLLLESGNHPEREIDKVTTPMGCTIAGLNEMEHNGLSSALIKGIVLSFNEINKLK